ncbi:hypothetical protein [Nocardia sp. CNY236]|uniref:hypothetical protein n=1 Tax=Nocardia sp. CNY236 TaxID=1169152 RepID=UPI0012DEBF3C|nr:hypothetical protein [Nocardia sp. CNY236]
MKIVIGALIPTVLLVLVVHRIRVNRQGVPRGVPTGITNPLTQLLLFLGLAKLCRVPVITDDIINRVLRDATGLANVMSLGGMTFGALAAIPILGVSSYITGRNLTPRTQLGIAFMIVTAMIATFLRTPMANTPTSYMSNDFPVTGPVMAYWLAYLTPLASALVIGCAYIIRELMWVRSGPFARALAAIALCELLGLVYCAFKVYNLYLQRVGIDNFWHQNAAPVSIALGLMALIAAGASAGIYATHILRDRFRRYRLLRDFGHRWLAARAANPAVVLDKSDPFLPTRRMCWTASRSGATAYRCKSNWPTICAKSEAQAPQTAPRSPDGRITMGAEDAPTAHPAPARTAQLSAVRSASDQGCQRGSGPPVSSPTMLVQV